MTSKSIKNKIASFEMGKVFRLEDLGLSRAEQNAAVVALGRLVQEGEIERLSPGNYYKPKRTRFGVVGPSMEERFRTIRQRYPYRLSDRVLCIQLARIDNPAVCNS